MANADEALKAATPIGAVLAAGEDVLSLYPQVIQFHKYVRLVLPADGFVFWIRADLLSPSALLNTTPLNRAALNQSQGVEQSATRLDAKGSLHYASDVTQTIDSNSTQSRVVFTSQVPVKDLNAIAPHEMYIAEFDGIQFSFSGRGGWYKQATTWHYVGLDVQSWMKSQIIDTPQQAATLFNRLIVSNSLPAWLAFNGYNPPWPVPLPMPNIPLFPSMLSPLNYPQVYGTVHIEPEATQALASTPSFRSNMTQEQLCTDQVMVSLYGVDNQMAQTFIACVMQAMYDGRTLGLMNVPTVRDMKRGQAEMLTIAMGKQVSFKVSYLQGVMRNLARQLIEKTLVDVYFPSANGSFLIAEVETNVITL